MFKNLDRIFSSVADGIVALDKDLRSVFMNDAAEQMLAVSREAVIGRTLMETFPPPGLESIRLIAVTGYGQDSDRQRSAAAGFHHHLVKPVNLQDVHAVLEGLIGEPSS